MRDHELLRHRSRGLRRGIRRLRLGIRRYLGLLCFRRIFRLLGFLTLLRCLLRAAAAYARANCCHTEQNCNDLLHIPLSLRKALVRAVSVLL